MMKKTVIFSLLMALILVAVPAAAKKKNGGTARPQATEKVYDFGTIKEANGAVSHDFTIANTGDGNLVIFDATAQCGCTRPEYPKNPVAPGKSAKIKVTFNPLGRSGAFEKSVTVKTNGDPRKVVLKIKGNIIPKK